MSSALQMDSLLLSHQKRPSEMESYSSSSKRIKKDYQTEPSGILQSHMSFQVKSLSHVQLFATPWTVAYQAPPSMGFSRQEY